MSSVVNAIRRDLLCTKCGMLSSLTKKRWGKCMLEEPRYREWEEWDYISLQYGDTKSMVEQREDERDMALHCFIYVQMSLSFEDLDNGTAGLVTMMKDNELKSGGDRTDVTIRRREERLNIIRVHDQHPSQTRSQKWKRLRRARVNTSIRIDLL